MVSDAVADDRLHNARGGVAALSPVLGLPSGAPPHARNPRKAVAGEYGPGDTGWRDAVAGAEFWFDAAAADLRVSFIEENLQHVKGEWAGQPLLLEPWEKDIVRALFGWKRPGGTRRFRKMLLFVPRKNGKTILLAAILLCLLFIDGEAGAEIYNVAATRKQAAICFKMAKQMVAQSPLLKRRVHTFKSAMEVPRTDSTYQALSSDQGGTQHGENPHGVGFDELHALKSPDLYEAMTTGSLARRQPLIVFTTTADVFGESICNAEYKYACDVRDGIVADPYYLAVIYEAPRDADGHYWDWKEERTWCAANPNFGVSIDSEAFRAEIQRAIDDPSKENQTKRLNLNIQTEQVTRWLAAERWRACATALPRPEFEAQLRGRDAFGALDLADRLDSSSFCLLFPPVPVTTPEQSAPAAREADAPVSPAVPSGQSVESVKSMDSRYRAFWRHWVCEEMLTGESRKLRAHARYYGPWAAGCICRVTPDAAARLDCPAVIHVTPGMVTDYDRIRADIFALGVRYNLREIAVDKAQATQLIGQLSADGFTAFEHGQSCLAMNPGISELERLIIGRLLEHSGDPFAAFAFSNIAIYPNNYGERRFEKSSGGKKMARVLRKIDPMQVLAMATGRAALQVHVYNAVKGATLL